MNGCWLWALLLLLAPLVQAQAEAHNSSNVAITGTNATPLAAYTEDSVRTQQDAHFPLQAIGLIVSRQSPCADKLATRENIEQTVTKCYAYDTDI